MSIWTPAGEHTPEPESDSPTQNGLESSAAPGGFDEEPMTEAEMAEMREMLAEVVATPVVAFLAQHAAQIHELALVHLSTASERGHVAISQAELAIDALGGIVEALGDRLGAASVPLREALAQVRVAFVQIAGEVEAQSAADAENG
ncbi:MAG: hypothetical protein WCG37_03940 [Actinomycetes bacterium]